MKDKPKPFSYIRDFKIFATYVLSFLFRKLQRICSAKKRSKHRKKEEIGFSRIPVKGELKNCVVSLESEPPKWASWSSGVIVKEMRPIDTQCLWMQRKESHRWGWVSTQTTDKAKSTAIINTIGNKILCRKRNVIIGNHMTWLRIPFTKLIM